MFLFYCDYSGLFCTSLTTTRKFLLCAKKVAIDFTVVCTKRIRSSAIDRACGYMPCNCLLTFLRLELVSGEGEDLRTGLS